MSLLGGDIEAANKTNAKKSKYARSELLGKIVDLTERLDIFCWGLKCFYTDVYLTSDSSRTLELINYKNRKYRALTDCDEIQVEIEAFRSNFGGHSEKINNASKKLDAVVDSFNKACTMVEGTYVLQESTRDLKSLKYVDAVTKLKEVHTKLDKMEFQGDLERAVRNFRAISETQLVVSQAQLSIEWSNIFRWNFNRTVDTLKFTMSVQQHDPILLQTVLKALCVADQLVIDIQEYSEFFIYNMLPNIIKYNCEILIEDCVGALIFTIKIDFTDTSRPSIATVFNNLVAIFEFLQSTIGSNLKPEHKFIETFGDGNRDEFFVKIIQDCIRSNLPCCESSYQDYKEIVIELEAFNKFLVDIKYVEEEESPFKKYIENTDLLLYDTKWNKMLAQARELVKVCFSGSTVSVGSLIIEPCDVSTSSIFDVPYERYKYNSHTPIFFSKCMVSQSVKTIAELITKHLEESAHLPLEFGNQLVRHIKDIAVMYECAVTDRHCSNLKSSPREIALFFNNCNYLAHTLVGPPWKNILPKRLADYLNSTLMSHIYDLRVVGMEKLSIFLKENKDVLTARVSGAYTGQVPAYWDEEAFETFSRNVNIAVGFLMGMKDAWSGVLPRIMYQHAIASLVGSLSEAMVKYVLWQMKHISETALFMLVTRFQLAIEEVHSVFLEPVTFKIKCYARFLLMPKLLQADLNEIADMWKNTKTINCNFSCEEIRRVIKMKFPNSNFRLQTIKRVQ